MDKEGRTPLHVACASGNMFDMVLTLLNLGANVKAYQPGTLSRIFELLIVPMLCQIEIQ